MAFLPLTSAAGNPPVAPAACDREITLRDPAVHESSGLAFSRRRPERFWTHNDSGDGPRLFAFDLTGRKTGECRIPRAGAVDWEDMAGYRDGDLARLVVADCGDNASQRDAVELYFFDEPDPDEVSEIDHFTRVRVTFADGARDCEAIGVDPVRGHVVLLTKSFYPAAGLYLLPLPSPRQTASPARTVQVERSRTIPMPLVTSLDIDASTGDVWVTNYFHAFRFPCVGRNQAIVEQLAALPRQQRLPAWKQIEASAVDGEGRVWVTGEAAWTPMGRLAHEPLNAGQPARD